MLGVWSFLRQFIYTKFVIVTDDDIDARDWKEVIWAVTTRMDPVRDTLLIDQTPIDYLDFASPVSGSWRQDGARCHPQAGRARRSGSGDGRSRMDAAVKARIDQLWPELGID
jgi:4-hydroxy-3-polyprenylbenzoate decarboxylase